MDELSIKIILDRCLQNNEIYLIDTILDYIREKCYLCNANVLRLNRSLNSSFRFSEIFVDICDNCIKDFGYKQCKMCENFFILKNFDCIVCRTACVCHHT